MNTAGPCRHRRYSSVGSASTDSGVVWYPVYGGTGDGADPSGWPWYGSGHHQYSQKQPNTAKRPISANFGPFSANSGPFPANSGPVWVQCGSSGSSGSSGFTKIVEKWSKKWSKSGQNIKNYSFCPAGIVGLAKEKCQKCLFLVFLRGPKSGVFRGPKSRGFWRS